MHWLLALLGGIWAVACLFTAQSAAQGFAFRFNLPLFAPVLESLFRYFLLLVGLTVMERIATRQGTFATVNSLPQRETAGQEFGRGAAMGWGLLLVAVLPLMLVGDLFPHYFWDASSTVGAAVGLVSALLLALCVELSYRGFFYRHLSAAVGPTFATVLVVVIAGTEGARRHGAGGLSDLGMMLWALLLCFAWQRTRAVWLGWGISFAWIASTQVLFGLPHAGAAPLPGVVATAVAGASGLTGGAYGPLGSAWTLVVLVAGCGVLFRVTREYAWEYTFEAPAAGGYPMEAAPPPEHTAMQLFADAQARKAEAATPQLVQIAPATPATASTLDTVNEHLQERGE